MASSFVNTGYRIEVDQEVQTHPAKHVESVEACDEEEKRCKIRRAISIVRKAGSTVNKVSPLPCLAAQESDTAQQGPQHPFFNGFAIHAMTCFHSQHHRYGTHDENEGHDTNEYKGRRNPFQERN